MSTVEQEILAELEAYIKLSKPGEQRAFNEPALQSLLTPELNSVHALLVAAVELVPDERYRRAAECLLVDPELRSANLTARNAAAADVFGVASDTFRKKINETSPRSEVLAEVALQLMRLSESPPRPDFVEGNQRVWRRSVRPRLLVGVVGLLAIVGVLSAVPSIWRGESLGSPAAPQIDSDTPDQVERLGDVDVTLYCETAFGSGWSASPNLLSPPSWTCRAPTGETEPADIDAACKQQYGTGSTATNTGGAGGWRCSLLSDSAGPGACSPAAGEYEPSMADQFARFTSEFSRKFEEAGGAEELGCPFTVMHRWTSGVMQELGRGDTSSAGLLAKNDVVVLLRGDSWRAFDRIKGINGAIVGFPENEPRLIDETFVVELDAGGSLVALHEDGPYFWLPPVMLPYWQSTGGVDGCLGFPITDPYAAGDSFKQDFERGRLIFSPLTGSFANEGPECE